MIRFRALQTNFSIPLLTLIFPLLAGRLGLSGAFPAVPIALCAHELAHLIAAKLLRIEISEIQLTPFGGSAKIANPYRLPAFRMFLVALAGPAANLLLAILCAALVHWGFIPAALAQSLVQVSLFMMAFNLLPALPLDGGRILYCILQHFIPEKKALRVCLMLGKILAALLSALAIWGFIRHRRLNLSLLLAAVFILSSTHDEQNALSSARIEKIVHASAEPAKPQRMQLYQVNADSPASEVLQLLRPHECAWLLLMQNRLPYALMDARSLLVWLTQHDSFPNKLSDLPCFLLAAQKKSDAG